MAGNLLPKDNIDLGTETKSWPEIFTNNIILQKTNGRILESPSGAYIEYTGTQWIFFDGNKKYEFNS